MSLNLPKPIQLFMSSENIHDPDTVADCFAPDATVRDEGRIRKGLNEIAAWRRETETKCTIIPSPRLRSPSVPGRPL